MKIFDLDYLQCVPEEIDRLSGAAGVGVTTSGTATGDITQVRAETRTISRSLPNGSSFAIGIGFVVAVAYDFPSP